MLDVTRAYGLTFLFPEGDTAVGASLRGYGEFARPEADFILGQLRRGPEGGALLDVGANIGAIALPVAAAERKRKVVALEAHRGLAGVLAANALNNQLYNVEVIHAAAGAEAGLARFPASSLASRTNFGMLGMHLNETVKTEAVRMCTLDEVAPERTAVVKVDVEGAELQVLQGARNLIEAVRPAWVLEANKASADTVWAAMALFRSAGYSLHWLWAPFVTPNHRKLSTAKPKITGDHNFVALPSAMENTWLLPPVAPEPQPAWPTDISDFAYLGRRYGFGSPVK